MPTALEQLRTLRNESGRVDTQKSQNTQKPSSTEMTLAQFAVSKRLLRIYSRVLDEEIWLAADAADVTCLPDGAVIYRARELALLRDWSPDGLRLAHEVKTRFGAELEPERIEPGL